MRPGRFRRGVASHCPPGRHRFRRGPFLALAGPAAADVVVPTRWEHVTLETWDGWTYYDVTVEPAEAAGYLLITRGDGSQRLMAYEEVRSARRRRRAPTSPTPSLPADALLFEPQSPPEFAQARPHHDQPPQLERWQPRFRFALSGTAGWGTSLGDWFSGLEGGFAYSGQVRVAMTPEFYFTALVRNQELDVSRLHAELSRRLPGLRRHRHRAPVRRRGRASCCRGAGTATSSRTVECLLAGASHDLTYDERGDIGDYVETLNDDQIAGILQFGALVPVSRALALDAQAHWMFTGAHDWAGGSVLGLSVGICVMLADAPAAPGAVPDAPQLAPLVTKTLVSPGFALCRLEQNTKVLAVGRPHREAVELRREGHLLETRAVEVHQPEVELAAARRRGSCSRR